jgi:GNAT superfamily N-acetyltransferase
VHPGYSIVVARPQDLGALAAIELEASKALVGHAPSAVLETAFGVDVMEEARRHGRLFVALAGEEPVGFALVQMLAPDLPHLEEIDVHPDHGQRGLGAALVRAVCDWTAAHGHEAVTLTAFRAVPWNMPFYQRLGFEEVPYEALRPELKQVVAAEAARGMDRERRAVLRYAVGGGG